jgi:ABC-type bacteriocin/lantibiotic exporter with double-glycine peptidase domain
LIIDEAMSSMDSQSEKEIFDGIRKIPGILAVIIVSHRLSSVQEAEMVYFLRNPGEIVPVARGELLSGDTSLRDLFAPQKGIQ